MKILFLETIHADTTAWLKAQSNIDICFIDDIDETDYTTIEAIVTRGIGKITAELITKCPDLKLVARCGVGLDNIDTAFCKLKNIKVVYAPGSNAQTTAEHTIALMINLQRNIYKAISDVKNGQWHLRNQHQSDELNGKTLGIIGLGNIGHRVAKIADAFGMKVVYWSKTEKEVNYAFLPFDSLLAKADILSVHLPLNSETENLFHAATFRQCKQGVLIVNTARANIFNRKDLLDALASGLVGGYAADVPMAPMPQSGDALNEHARTLITPHVSSLTDSTFYKMCQYTMENVVNILNGNAYDDKCIFQ